MEPHDFTHPEPVPTPARPSADEARERIHQHQPSDANQRLAWNAVLAALVILLVVAVFFASR